MEEHPSFKEDILGFLGRSFDPKELFGHEKPGDFLLDPEADAHELWMMNFVKCAVVQPGRPADFSGFMGRILPHYFLGVGIATHTDHPEVVNVWMSNAMADLRLPWEVVSHHLIGYDEQNKIEYDLADSLKDHKA